MWENAKTQWINEAEQNRKEKHIKYEIPMSIKNRVNNKCSFRAKVNSDQATMLMFDISKITWTKTINVTTSVDQIVIFEMCFCDHKHNNNEFLGE